MRYLITYKDESAKPFMTNWYDFENNYSEGMVVYDFIRLLYTSNGTEWKELYEDHL